MSLDLIDIRIDAEGTNAPPKNMIEAARRSLSPEAFEQLMERTGGKAPTPAELVAFADAERELEVERQKPTWPEHLQPGAV